MTGRYRLGCGSGQYFEEGRIRVRTLKKVGSIPIKLNLNFTVIIKYNFYNERKNLRLNVLGRVNFPDLVFLGRQRDPDRELTGSLALAANENTG